MSSVLVLDSSVALAWCFPDERAWATDAILLRLRGESADVPSLWFLEMTNVLALAVRRGRIVQARVEEFIKIINSLQFDVDYEWAQRAFEHLYPLCRAHSLTSYDAVYLDLALRSRLPLATLDSSLRHAATTIGVPLLGI